MKTLKTEEKGCTDRSEMYVNDLRIYDIQKSPNTPLHRIMEKNATGIRDIPQQKAASRPAGKPPDSFLLINSANAPAKKINAETGAAWSLAKGTAPSANPDRNKRPLLSGPDRRYLTSRYIAADKSMIGRCSLE